MSRKMRRLLPAFGGLLAGLCLGLSVTVAVLVFGAGPKNGLFDEMKLKAVAASSSETLAIATGPIDEEVEGVYCLDFVTGDLNCYVISPRSGRASGHFKTNIIADLPLEKGKKASYALATGTVQTRAATGNSRPSFSVVYVADSNTGYVAGYSFPWSKAASAADAAQASPMTRVFFAKGRTLELRE